MEILVKSEEDLLPAASQLLAAMPEARIFALSGEMGAGKTTFIKAICRILGVSDIVQSPTFAIINEYRTSLGEPVYHFDFYRIRNISEVYDLGYEDYLDSGHYCLLEWPELIGVLLPPEAVRVNISGSNERTISF